MTWRDIRDGITIILGFIGMVIACAIFAATFSACGGDGGDDGAERVLEANGIPAGPSIDCSGGDVTITNTGDGSIHAESGDGGDCGNVAEAEEEDGGAPVPEGTVAPFLGS